MALKLDAILAGVDQFGASRELIRLTLKLGKLYVAGCSDLFGLKRVSKGSFGGRWTSGVRSQSSL